MRSCGECTACCKVMEIPQINKPRQQWCQFCKKGKGCAIYDIKPQPCTDYKCQWLLGNLHERDRPDKLGIILDYQDDFCGDERALLIREVFPGASAKERVQALIRAFRERHLLIVQYAENRSSVMGPPEIMHRVAKKMEKRLPMANLS